MTRSHSHTAGSLSRRSLISCLGAGAGIAMLGACTQRPSGGDPGGDSSVELGVGWWGSEDRHQATLDALETISEKTGFSFTTDYGDWGSYWDKLTTQMSGGTAPDIVSMNVPQELTDFATRNALLPLDEYVGTSLDLSALSDGERDGGLVDGTLYGVTLATLCPALIPNLTKLDELGLSLPDAWTWEELADFAKSVYDNSGGTLHGIVDATESSLLESFLMQRGHPGLYDGTTLAGTEEDFVDWFLYWADLRAAGGTVTAEINAADDGSHPNNPVVKGQAVIGAGFNITVDVWAPLISDQLGYAWIPSDTDITGNYQGAASQFSINAATDHPDEALEFITMFISDPDVSQALGFSRGVPNATALDALTDLSEDEQALVDYSTAVAAEEPPPRPGAPTGAADVSELLARYADEVAFGQRDPEDGARSFFAEASEVPLGD